MCRKSLTAVDETAAVGSADSDILSSSSDVTHADGSDVGQLLENLPAITVDMETSAGVEVPVLLPSSVIDDVEYFETDTRF